MNKSFDVMVLGMGAVGSAALYYLSKKGLKVAGVDQYRPPHELGSSHGESRIIRQAYYESTLYVPFAQKATALWLELEEISGRALFLQNGSLMIGNRNSEVVTGALNSAKAYHIAHDYLDGPALKHTYPAFKIPEDTVAVLEKVAGLLYPEKCIGTYLQLAETHAAVLLYDEQVLKLNATDERVEVITNKGSYYADQVILSAGAWMGKLLENLDLPLKVERRTVHWFRDGNNNRNFLPGNLPVYIWEYEKDKLFYGFPDIGGGIKIASTRKGVQADPDQLNRKTTKAERDEVEQLVRKYFNMEPVHANSSVCMYTNTPDEDFIIDFHPDHKNIIIASTCSGHGFKFSSFTGKLLAQMATNSFLDLDISPFSINRFNVP